MAATTDTTTPAQGAKSFDAILDDAISSPTQAVVGLVIAAKSADGSTLYTKAAGKRSLDPDSEPMDPNASYWIASCTKLLTSICTLQLVEQGKINLDQDVGSVVPELADRDVIHADPDSEDGFRLERAKGKVLIRHLLTHTSGSAYYWMNPTLSAWRKKHGPSAEELAGKVFAMYDTPLLFEPGQGWVYGGSLDWAGTVVERISGLTLGDYMEKNIFQPLGMESTTFHLDQRKDILDRLQPAAYRIPEGSLAPMDSPLFSYSATEHSGGGGLWSTVPDYMAVLTDLISPQPKLLKKETVENLLAAPQLAADSPALNSLTQARAATAANAAAAATIGVNHGLGGMLITKDMEQVGLPAGTLTWGGLPNLKWFIHPGLGVAAMYATQVMPPGDVKNNELSSEFFKEVIRLAKAKKAAV